MSTVTPETLKIGEDSTCFSPSAENPNLGCERRRLCNGQEGMLASQVRATRSCKSRTTSTREGCHSHPPKAMRNSRERVHRPQISERQCQHVVAAGSHSLDTICQVRVDTHLTIGRLWVIGHVLQRLVWRGSHGYKACCSQHVTVSGFVILQIRPSRLPA